MMCTMKQLQVLQTAGCQLVYTCVSVQGGGGRGEKEERRGDEVWSSSQDSLGEWASEEMELEHLQALSRCSTDDDKISESLSLLTLSHCVGCIQ